MSKFSDFVSGGGGTLINEVKFFTDRGDSFTDSNGHVWLKAGARTLDTTTYPDADTNDVVMSFSSDYQAGASTGQPAKGLGVSSDGAWTINRFSGTSVSHTDIATDTVNTFTAYSGFTPFSCGYVKCAATSGLASSVSNANGYFAGMLGSFNGTSLVSFHLVGGSGTDAGKTNGLAAWLVLRDGSGTALNNTPYSYTADSQPAAFHFNPGNRQLYVMFSYSTDRCHLFRYSMSSNAWGNTNAGNGTSSYINANQVVDWQTQSSAYRIYHMSGSSTHLYVYYQDADYAPKMRKIPFSGNLNWSTGTDVGNFPYSFFVQNSNGSFEPFSKHDFPVYYRTVGSTDKFLVHDNTNYNNRIKEVTLDTPIIGQDSWDYRRAQTAYQRIK
jgi:hypothetical protein